MTSNEPTRATLRDCDPSCGHTAWIGALAVDHAQEARQHGIERLVDLDLIPRGLLSTRQEVDHYTAAAKSVSGYLLNRADWLEGWKHNSEHGPAINYPGPARTAFTAGWIARNVAEHGRPWPNRDEPTPDVGDDENQDTAHQSHGGAAGSFAAEGCALCPADDDADDLDHVDNPNTHTMAAPVYAPAIAAGIAYAPGTLDQPPPWDSRRIAAALEAVDDATNALAGALDHEPCAYTLKASTGLTIDHLHALADDPENSEERDRCTYGHGFRPAPADRYQAPSAAYCAPKVDRYRNPAR